MSWKRYFTPVTTNASDTGNYSPLGGSTNSGLGPAQANYSSYLPDVYVGSPNRVERYGQYNTMDMDSEVNAALDILAEFCTQKNKQNKTPFIMDFKQKATNSEITVLQQYLLQWSKLENFETRMFRIVRNIFKYGDAFFIRDPETKRWFHVDPAKVSRIIVNESEGKKPEQYIIRDVNLNFREMVATTPHQTTGNVTGGGAGYLQGGVRGYVGASNATAGSGSRFMKEIKETAIDAENVVHLSLSEGLDNNYPFGNSLLESIFKVYKQKELLEDAIIIYRVQRAPERRVFYIDVGNMPTNKAMAFIERVKNEIHQKRIPNKTGGGANVMDAAYNPLSMIEDYFFAQTAEGRGSKVETLPGGQNLGEIDDLKYFNNKLMKGLRIPSSYLPSTPEDPGSAFTDGRVGTAYIQEFRFTKYCQRIQALLGPTFDKEFKMFLKLECSIVFFISAKKLSKKFGLLKEYFPEREILICREITKIHEHFYRSKISEIENFQFNPKGEVTVIISEKYDDNKKEILNESDKVKIKKLILDTSVKDIVRIISQQKNISKSKIYNYCLQIKNEK